LIAVEACADDTKGQTCYICTQALHWKTKEGLVRGCACRGTAGFVHVSCLAEQAKILRDRRSPWPGSPRLSGDGPFTVFAPTNEAFAALTEGTLESLLEPANKDLLVQILTYHVVSGTALSTDLTEGKLGTVQGEAVDVTLDPIAINGAGVAIPDVLATNGVVHVIDAVLIPPEGL